MRAINSAFEKKGFSVTYRPAMGLNFNIMRAIFIYFGH